MKKKRPKGRIVYLVANAEDGLKFGGEWDLRLRDIKKNIAGEVYPWVDPVVLRAVVIDRLPRRKRKS